MFQGTGERLVKSSWRSVVRVFVSQREIPFDFAVCARAPHSSVICQQAGLVLPTIANIKAGATTDIGCTYGYKA